MLMKKIILYVLSSLTLCFSVTVMAEDVTVYMKSSTINQVDMGAKGYSVGDTIARHGPVYFEEDGPVIGEFFTQAQISHIYDDQKKDVRFFLMEINLPDGEIMTMDFTPVISGPLAVGGHKHRGVIVGGTGKYAGIKGSYELLLNPNTQMTKVLLKII